MDEKKITPSERAMKWQKDHPERAKINLANYLKRNKKRLRAEYLIKRKTPEFKADRTASQDRFNAANPWYKCYQGARSRCVRPKDISFKHYGGKGIKFLLSVEEVKTLWFRDNAAEMKKPSIDRKDSSKDYVFDNCRFREHVSNARGGLIHARAITASHMAQRRSELPLEAFEENTAT